MRPRFWVPLLILALVIFQPGLPHRVNISTAADVPTPGPGAQTIYAVTNPNAVPLLTTHTFYRELTPEPVWSFASTVPAAGTSRYYTLWYTQLTSPFTGSVRIEASMPFTAEVVGYEYVRTPTPAVTPTRTPTPVPFSTTLPVRR